MLIFKPDQKENSFYLEFTDTSVDQDNFVKEILLESIIKGENANLYFLESNQITFTITAIENELVKLNSFLIDDFSLNYARFLISTSKQCILHYLIGLKGTLAPSLFEIKNRKSKEPIINPQFGSVFIYKDEIYQKYFTIENLLPSYEYVIYYFLENLGQATSLEPYSYQFKTKDRYKTADISIRLNQTFITRQEKITMMKHIGVLLSLDESKIIEKKIYQTSVGRRLQNKEQ